MNSFSRGFLVDICVFIVASLIALLVLLAVVRHAEPAGGDRFTREDLRQFGEVIRRSGYVCGDADSARYLGNAHRGSLFMVSCQEKTLLYRITLTPNNRFLVKPWGE